MILLSTPLKWRGNPAQLKLRSLPGTKTKFRPVGEKLWKWKEKFSLTFVSAPSGVSGSGEYETSGSSGHANGLTGIMVVAKSKEFSYQELAKATNNFSMEYKIGQGGFGAVYYAELRGEKTAIKKMDVQASSSELLCELKVLTHVHHLNLVYHPFKHLKPVYDKFKKDT